MTDDRLNDLLLLWEEARAADGTEVSIEELCADCPELLEQVRAYIRALQRLDPLLADGDAEDPYASLYPPGADADRSLPTVPGYEIQGELGRGGMGVVYQARQVKLNRPVALKMILAGGHAGPKERQRFRTEAEAVACLQHPNIVQIYDVGEHEGRPFLALEYIPGGSLAQHLRRGPLPVREAAQLVETLAHAMHCAHEHGVIHRDLKPANILLQKSEIRNPKSETDQCPGVSDFEFRISDFTPKVADFGLAKQLDGGLGPTATSDIMGTPSYMAPEQAAGKSRAISPATDVYALGAILYETLTGRPPFRAESPLETLHQVLHAEPVSLHRLRTNLPRDLEIICLKCLEKEPAKRYPSAEALAEDLHRFLAGKPIQARPVGTSERVWRWCQRNPSLAVVGTVAVGAMLGLVVFAFAFAFQKASAAREVGAALRRSEQMNLALSLDRGLTLCAQGEVAPGLLWLARALELDPDEAGATADAVRLNLTAWRPRLHAVRAILPIPNAGENIKCFDLLALSPDGATLVGGSDQRKTLLLWDTASGQPREKSLAHPQAVGGLAFHPNGTLVTTCRDGSIRFWDVTTAKQIRAPLMTQGVHQVAISRDGRTLLTSDYTAAVQFWDIGPGMSLTPTECLAGRGGTTVLAVSPDGRFFVAGSETILQVRDMTTHRPIGSPLVHWRSVWSAAFSPDGETVVTAGDGGAWAWETRTGKRRFALPHPTRVHRVAVSPDDGRFILTPGTDATVGLWETATGKPAGAPFRLARPGWAAVFSPDGQAFITPGGVGDNVLLLETSPEHAADRLLRTPHVITAVRFSSDGRTLLTAGPKVWLPHLGEAREFVLHFLRTRQWLCPEVQFWDAATHLKQGAPLTHAQWYVTAAFSPDGTKCLVGSGISDTNGGDAQLWDLATRRPLAQPTHGNGVGIVAVAYSPDGQTYLTGGTDGTARLWETDTGTLRYKLDVGETVRGVAYSPDGRTLLTGDADQTAQRWDAATGQKLGEPLIHPAPVASVSFSPDGKSVLTGCQDNRARIWDPETRQVVQTFTHGGWVLAAVFSRDGSMVLTGSADGTARLWHRVTGLPIGPPVQHEQVSLPGGVALDWVPTVTFSPDGRTLVTGGVDQTARFRPVPRPVAGTPKRIRLWVEVVTGMRLDDNGVVQSLNADQWQERGRQLEALGGPPQPPSP